MIMTKRQYLSLIWSKWAYSSNGDGNYTLPVWTTFALTLKASICVLLNWWAERDDYRADKFELACFDVHRTYHHEFGSGEEWAAVAVFVGWRNWQVMEYQDGYP